MNAKIDLPLWQVETPKLMPSNIMVVGVDIYHKLIKKKSSCVGFVASIDQKLNSFYSRNILTEQGQMFVNDISNLMIDACQNYLKHNKTLPETIIVYRDGVGES